MSNTVTPALLAKNVASPVDAMFEGLEQWLNDFQKYDAILAEMAQASADSKFFDELATIEQWFNILSEPERTASIYTLLQRSTQDQIRFFMTVMQKMVKPENSAATNIPAKSTGQKNPKIGLRPANLNIPLPDSSTLISVTTPRSQDPTPVLLNGSDRLRLPKLSSRLTPTSPFVPQEGSLRTPALSKSWASLVNTPLIPMFHKPDTSQGDVPGSGAINGSWTPASTGDTGPGLAAISPATLNMLASSGLSNDAQLLAVQLVMSGILQPVDTTPTPQAKQAQEAPQAPQSVGKNNKKGKQWKTPSGTKHPSTSNLRANMPKSPGLRKRGLKSSEPTNGGPDSESPKVEEFNPELLKNIPAWLRSLRLHKYAACFEGMTWQEMVVLDDKVLEEKGVAALGARRRLLRAFDHVNRETKEGASSETPIIPDVAATTPLPFVAAHSPVASQETTPATKLSADSPAFMPTGKIPYTTAAVVAPIAV